MGLTVSRRVRSKCLRSNSRRSSCALVEKRRGTSIGRNVLDDIGACRSCNVEIRLLYAWTDQWGGTSSPTPPGRSTIGQSRWIKPSSTPSCATFWITDGWMPPRTHVLRLEICPDPLVMRPHVYGLPLNAWSQKARLADAPAEALYLSIEPNQPASSS